MGNGPAKDIVVGVVGNARINALSNDDATEQYWPAQPDNMPDMVVVARTAGEPGLLPAAARSISLNLNPWAASRDSATQASLSGECCLNRDGGHGGRPEQSELAQQLIKIHTTLKGGYLGR